MWTHSQQLFVACQSKHGELLFTACEWKHSELISTACQRQYSELLFTAYQKNGFLWWEYGPSLWTVINECNGIDETASSYFTQTKFPMRIFVSF